MSAKQLALLCHTVTEHPQVPILGLESLELRDLQPASSDWDLKVAVTSHQGLGKIHCLAVTEAPGPVILNP